MKLTTFILILMNSYLTHFSAKMVCRSETSHVGSDPQNSLEGLPLWWLGKFATSGDACHYLPLELQPDQSPAHPAATATARILLVVVPRLTKGTSLSLSNTIRLELHRPTLGPGFLASPILWPLAPNLETVRTTIREPFLRSSPSSVLPRRTTWM